MSKIGTQEFARRYAKKYKQGIAHANSIVKNIMELIQETLVGGEDITFTGVVSLAVKERAEREGKNLLTGKWETYPAKKVLRAKAGKRLEDALNS